MSKECVKKDGEWEIHYNTDGEIVKLVDNHEYSDPQNQSFREDVKSGRVDSMSFEFGIDKYMQLTGQTLNLLQNRECVSEGRLGKTFINEKGEHIYILGAPVHPKK